MAEIKINAKNPFSAGSFQLDEFDIADIIDMKKSGLMLYRFLLLNHKTFLSVNGIAYLNPIEITEIMNVTRKTVYNGIQEMIINKMLHRTGLSGEYFFNPKFFPTLNVKI